ncbi:MAG: hypothetical protein ABIQ39_06575 [Ilumatobacteraceae bacterium]
MNFDQQRSLNDEQAERFVTDGGPWMSCDECFDHLDEYVEMPAVNDPDWLPAMTSHLSTCQACREEVESLLVLVDTDS